MTKITIYLFFLVLFSCSTLPKERKDKLSIIQGLTNTKLVEFNVMSAKGQALRFELRSSEGEILSPIETVIDSRDFSKHDLHHVLFQRDATKMFNLYVYDGEKTVDQRLVGMGQLEDKRLKLAVVSCMEDRGSRDFPIWDTLSGKNPEYLLMIGDNVYADEKDKMADPETLWKRYEAVRLALPIFYQEKLIPIHALWDDHDYGANGGNMDYPHREESEKIFHAFFAQELGDDEWVKSFGTGGVLTLGDFNLYFLDGRSYRSPKTDGKHLGENQEKWFLSKLREENAPSFIIKGDQFFGGYHRFESFEGNHPQDFQKFVGDLKKIPTPFIFVSGDRHLSEIMQFPRSLFGKPSFEITSSPVHAKVYPDSEDLNPWRVVANKAESNFTIISSMAQDNHWFMEVEAINTKGKTLYKRELAVYIKDLQDNMQEIRKKRSGKRRSYRHTRSRRGRR